MAQLFQNNIYIYSTLCDMTAVRFALAHSPGPVNTGLICLYRIEIQQQ